ncbi:MAG: 1-(5-phosphoribosyl)-5-[(5-phosphoribosylamino)methylideneamino] imidazole-4-carboxamide isomerase, partial [Saprospiraceae bacterium]|nr:1-(5-phosphoribosyl)-5-[(5-phosphoribosylamino)methylideneamino] imidazole-4-carboxamide isomerase [Saprospiraceae bacterium]
VYERKKIYHSDPLDVAKSFEDHGITRLHLVDLDGAKAKRVINWGVVKKIVEGTNLTVDFGGGIKSEEDLKKILDCGAHQVTVGSVAAQSPELFLSWLDKFGPEIIILGADVKNGYIAAQGWLKETNWHWRSFVDDYFSQGVRHVICTDISKDGMLAGPALDLYQDMLEVFPKLKLTASGGVSSMDDVREIAAIGCHACIIGKAIYEGKITLLELQNFQNAG